MHSGNPMKYLILSKKFRKHQRWARYSKQPILDDKNFRVRVHASTSGSNIDCRLAVNQFNLTVNTFSVGL